MRIFVIGLLTAMTVLGCGQDREANEHPSQLSGIGACLKGHMTEQCLNRRVCRIVCGTAGGATGFTLGGSAGAAAGIAAGTQVCSEACDLVPECSQVFICDRYERVGF